MLVPRILIDLDRFEPHSLVRMMRTAMGTIVAVRKDSQVVIGSDCCNIRDPAMRTGMNISHGCILRFGESFIGLNSSLGFQQALEEILPSLTEDPASRLSSRAEIREFFGRLHHILKANFGLYVNYQQGQEFEWTPMSALVANPAGIYKIDSTRAVYEFTRFWALGTGEPYALGAMAVLFDKDVGASEIAQQALAAVKQIEGASEREVELLTLESKRVIRGRLTAVPADPRAVKRVARMSRPERPRNRSR